MRRYTGQTEYEFRVRLDGYELVELDDNCLYLKDVESGEISCIIDSVYMIDDEGKTDFNNYYTYIERGNGVYDITAHVNEEFLTNENTVYPVVIDPTITIQKSGSTKVSIRDIMCGSEEMTVECRTLETGYPWWTEESANWKHIGNYG